MNLLELVQAQLSEERLDRLASIVSESGTATRKAVGAAALPAVLAGLSGEFAGEAGAARLLELMRAGGHDGSLLANLDGALSGGAHTEALLNLGKGQLGAILGDRIDALTDLMAADTGIRRGSAGALLGLLVPIVLAVLGRQLHQAGGASRLAALLAGARPAIALLAASGLPAALGIADLAAPVPAADAPAPRGAIWSWLIVPACALAMFFALRSCQQNSMREATVSPTPATPAAAAPAAAAAPTLPEITTPPPSSEVPFPGPGAAPVSSPAPGAAPPASATPATTSSATAAPVTASPVATTPGTTAPAATNSTAAPAESPASR